MRVIDNNEKLLYNLIKYYYIQKKMTLREIGKRLGIGRTRVSDILHQQKIDVVPDVNLNDRLKMGFHLHHRIGINFSESAKLSNVSINALREYFNNKSVPVKPSSYGHLTEERKKVFRFMWKDIRNYKQKRDFKTPKQFKRIISPRMGDTILDYFKKEYTPAQMYNEGIIPTNPYTIKTFLKENNLNPQANDDFSRLYTVNKKYFLDINSEEKAYWLGFLLGDGCVYGDEGKENWSLSLTLQYKDKEHLKKFKQAVEATNPIYVYLVDKRYKTCRIHIQSTPLVKSIEKFGIIRNKTYITKFPNNIPSEFTNHFLRGIFDADGSIPKSNGKVMGISICGTIELIEDIIKLLGVDKKYMYIRKDLVNFAELRCHKMKEALRILDYIYKDATVFMPRKYKRYMQLQERYLNMINKKIRVKNNEGVETIETIAL